MPKTPSQPPVPKPFNTQSFTEILSAFDASEQLVGSKYASPKMFFKELEPALQLKQVGTDCEIFLQDQAGEVFPAIGLVGGTKHEPRPVLNEPGFAVQEDNVMLEFNIPPANSADDFVKKISRMLEFCTEEMKKKGYSLRIAPSAMFTSEQLKHPQARAIGCEPDFCVWSRSENKVKFTKETKNLRSSGGHIHVSYNTKGSKAPSIRDVELVIKAMDMFLGVPSVILDTDTERKKLYGKAGCFRAKDYGIEYRTLSNFWIKSPELINWAYGSVQAAFAFINSRGFDWAENWFGDWGNQIYLSIDQQNKDAAEIYLDKWNKQFKGLFRKLPHSGLPY